MDWPIFTPVPVTGGQAPVELFDFRTLPLDPTDVSSPGMICMGQLLQAWIDKFGEPTDPVTDPDKILFCVEPSGPPVHDVIGAGALYDVAIVEQTGADVTILCDVLATSQVPGVVEAIMENINGFVIQAEDPQAPIQKVTITVRG